MVQVAYALDNRGAGERLLSLAADRGMAVMVNCESWVQLFLKYIAAHPAVTCAIPGTARVKYVADNLGAARGRPPTAATRRRMEQFIDGL